MSGSGIGTPAVAGDALFTVAEARAHDKAQLASAADFTSAAIIAKEAEIRSLFVNACKRDWFPTTHTDEYQDGYGAGSIPLDWPFITSITAASTRSDTTWTPLTAGELLQLQPLGSGELYWAGCYWPVGFRNVKVTYVAGYATVPPLIKKAALDLCVNELPVGNAPWQADSSDIGGTSYSFTRGDGYNGAWSSLPSVMLALRMYGSEGAMVGIG